MTPRRTLGFCGLLALLLLQPAFMQPGPLLAQSAATAPAGPMDGYLDHAAYVAQLEALDQQSARVTVSSLGTTLGDRPNGPIGMNRSGGLFFWCGEPRV